MKKLLYILSIGSLCIFSCSSNDDEQHSCGEEKVTYFPGMTGPVFLEYTTQHVDENVYRSTRYSVVGTYAQFTFGTAVSGVCATADVLISPTLVLKAADPNLRDSLLVSSSKGNPFIEPIFPSNGLVYQVDETYTFTNIETTADFAMSNIISFPTQGSWSADSAYFFSNLDSYYFSSQYTLAQ